LRAESAVGERVSSLGKSEHRVCGLVEYGAVDTCEQCGFRYESLAVADIAGRLRDGPEGYRLALTSTFPERILLRPRPDVWSALEYACHVRDVLLVQRDRAILAQVEDRPSFARMHREERVALCRYNDQGVDDVLAQLKMAGALCALVFSRLDDVALSRRLVYNWPDAAERDLAWLGRHTVHEVEHHLQDVDAVLRGVAPFS
jgi:DNA segregation ATPase FtsK/SpoIIIE, S-DNA-T family